MKFIAFTFLLTFGVFITQAQEKPMTVHSVIKVYKTFDWYATQYNLWEKEIKKDKTNESAWVNYYTAARMAKITATDDERAAWEDKMNTVITAVNKEIPDTYTYYCLNAWHNSFFDATTKAEQDALFAYAEKAHQLKPEDPAVYPDLMNYYLLNADEPKIASISKKWFDSGDISPNIYAMNYNMLMSTEKNAILLTAGDNDTYPSVILQQAKNVRTDITVINVFLGGQIAEYRNNMFKKLNIPSIPDKTITQQALIDHIIKHKQDMPLYFAFGGYFGENENLKDNLYNVGMAMLYCENPINNTSLLVKNFEQHFLLDHLAFNVNKDEFPEQVKRHNLTYLPGLLLLHKHYKLMENERQADKTKTMILQIVSNTPYEAQVKEALVKP